MGDYSIVESVAKADAGVPAADPIPVRAPAAFETIRAGAVDRAANDLFADYRRQHSSLTRAQFDRLVLRRNLTPPEMIALTDKLRQMGVGVDDEPKQVSNRGEGVDTTAPPAAETRTNATKGTTRQRSPYALLTSLEETELGRRIQLALRVQADLDPSKVSSLEIREIVQRGLQARERMIVANLRLVRFAINNARRPTGSLIWTCFRKGPSV